jgi:hypothetical protein
LENEGVPLRLTGELIVDQFLGEVKKQGKRRASGHPRDLETLYQLLCTQQQATQQEQRGKPKKHKHRYQSFPKRKPMAFLPCFTQHSRFRDFVEKFKLRCQTRKYASLVVEHRSAPAFFIVQKSQDPEDQSMKTYFTSKWQAISICGGGKCEQCEAH